MGLTSFSQHNIRSFDGKPPEFGGYAWDYTAPCYLSGIAQYDRKARRSVPGFLLADICLDRTLSIDDISPFLAKLKVLRARRGVWQFIPCFIASQLELPALKTLRANNVLVGLLDNIFDKEMKDLIEALIYTLERAAAFASSNPERIEYLLEGLSKLEGETLNVRGALFTLIVGHYFSSKGAHIEINKEISDPQSGGRGDIDVLAVENMACLTCVECRGKSSKALVTKKEAERWLTDRVPLMRNYLLSHDSHKNKKMVFEFWTTGHFDKEATEMLQARRKSMSRYEINFRDRSDILDLLKVSKLNNLVRMIEEHYESSYTAI